MRVSSKMKRLQESFARRIAGMTGLGLWPLIAAFALALVVPLSAPLAETDCGSLDIALESSAEFPELKCDTSSFAGGGPSQTEEGIVASGTGSLFVIRHVVAGVRTYFNRQDTRALVDIGGAFAKIENWTSAPGGNQFMVARFRGRLTGKPDLPLACFAFSRFTGHVARSSGFRHIVYGFYCTALAEDMSDDDVRRLIDAVKFSFE
jgi:hypothetical protein